MIIGILSTFVFFGAIGILIGQRKGRTLAGLLFGMILGPIGWLVVALGPSKRELLSRPCPHCNQLVVIDSKSCGQCAGAITWLGKDRPVKASRAA
jgi:hypothetical protein